MKKNVLNTDLTGKVAVVTGAGGVLCSYFAKVLARAGAKVYHAGCIGNNGDFLADILSDSGADISLIKREDIPRATRLLRCSPE